MLHYCHNSGKQRAGYLIKSPTPDFRYAIFCNGCMVVAKIIRHRHKYHHYINDDLKSVREETFFKIIFSEPAEMEAFKKWCRQYKGEYDYDKDNSCQRGTLPQVELFKDEICWCDIMAYYLLHVAGYSYHSSLNPYKGEVYIKGSTT